MTILEFAKTYGLDVRKLTQAIDNLKTIQAILDQAILDRSEEEKPREAKRMNHMDELINEIYSTNADFKTYVDKYMRKEEIDLETALSHAMVQNYANYLMDRGEAEPTLRNLWKNDEDKGC